MTGVSSGSKLIVGVLMLCWIIWGGKKKEEVWEREGADLFFLLWARQHNEIWSVLIKCHLCFTHAVCLWKAHTDAFQQCCVHAFRRYLLTSMYWDTCVCFKSVHGKEKRVGEQSLHRAAACVGVRHALLSGTDWPADDSFTKSLQ